MANVYVNQCTGSSPLISISHDCLMNYGKLKASTLKTRCPALIHCVAKATWLYIWMQYYIWNSSEQCRDDLYHKKSRSYLSYIFRILNVPDISLQTLYIYFKNMSKRFWTSYIFSAAQHNIMNCQCYCLGVPGSREGHER